MIISNRDAKEYRRVVDEVRPNNRYEKSERTLSRPTRKTFRKPLIYLFDCRDNRKDDPWLKSDGIEGKCGPLRKREPGEPACSDSQQDERVVPLFYPEGEE